MVDRLSSTDLVAWRRSATGLLTRGTDGAAADSAAVVRRHLAVQAQDYRLALWSVGQRTAECTEAEVRDRLDSGALLRTHVLRPTWHLVAPEDLRWLLDLTGPRVQRSNGGIYRRHGLDRATRDHATGVIAEALRGGRSRTRAQLADVLADAGLPYDGEALAHVCMHAELEQVICSGPMSGRQQTYALWDDRVPPTPQLDRDEAVARLVRCYLTGHGPASVKDLRWWSSLTLSTLRQALAALGDEIAHFDVGGTVWLAVGEPPSTVARGPRVDLLQACDEYVLGFSETRDLVADDALPPSSLPWINGVVVDGLVVGGWRWVLRTRGVTIEVTLARELTAAERDALDREADRLGAFLDLTPTVTITTP